jgi:hypothetical protein
LILDFHRGDPIRKNNFKIFSKAPKVKISDSLKTEEFFWVHRGESMGAELLPLFRTG